jgi:glycosyltransferase involved in cell wall biosynthesis
MSFDIVSVAYPLAPVHSDCVGGAEQVLFQLDRALVAAGHRSTVIAMAGAEVAGNLIPVPCHAELYDPTCLRQVEEEARGALDLFMRKAAPDLIHIHAVNFPALLPKADVPVLVTLHLPRSYYRDSDLRLHLRRPHLRMNCVSHAQHASFSDVPGLVRPIENCVESTVERPFQGRRRFAVWLGRICPEKGTHLAMEACARASVPLIVAGKVFPYADHLRYFREQVTARLAGQCRFIGSVSGDTKRRLLHEARCVIVTTTVPETSSLVAREALAAGTPVVALKSPALQEIVEDGRTGFLVNTAAELPAAIAAAAELDGQNCLDAARSMCAHHQMIREYFALYARLSAHGPVENSHERMHA